MKIVKAIIKDILSIGEVTVDFNDNGLILLDGYNHDDDTSNGAGKTSILNAISFGLYDKAPRKISKAAFLRRGAKKGYSHITIECNGVTWEVIRSRPNSVQFFKNGEDIKISQEEFENSIGLSYDQFLITMYSAQSEGKKLVSLNDTDKKDFFLQLMNLQYFSDSKRATDKLTKEKIAEITKLELVITEATSRMASYKESLVDEDAVKQELASYDLTALQEQSATIKFIKPDMSKFNDLEDKLRAKKDSNNKKRMAQFAISQEHVLNKVNLDNLKKQASACPDCGYIDPDLQSKIDALQAIVNIEPIMINYIEDEKKIEKTLADLRVKRELELKDYNEQSELSTAIKKKITVAEFNIRACQSKLDRNTELTSKITEYKKLYDKASTKKGALEIECEILQTVSSIFSPTGAPAYIMDSTVDTFNEKVSRYIDLIWPAASYELKAYKENKTGDIKAKFSEKLTINDKESSIGALSGGEFRCLSIAIDFAVIDVLNAMFGVSINPIFLDEPFNGLDVSNRERVVELLENISNSKQIWIIDHASEAKAMFSDVVRIEKRDGISQLV